MQNDKIRSSCLLSGSAGGGGCNAIKANDLLVGFFFYFDAQIPRTFDQIGRRGSRIFRDKHAISRLSQMRASVK